MGAMEHDGRNVQPTAAMGKMGDRWKIGGRSGPIGVNGGQLDGQGVLGPWVRQLSVREAGGTTWARNWVAPGHEG